MNKWKTASLIMGATLLITITVTVINLEKMKIQNEGPEIVYIGHNEKILDNAYEELISSVKKLEKNTTDEKSKLELNTILKTAKDDEVILENFNKDSAVKALQNIFLGIGSDLMVEGKMVPETPVETGAETETPVETGVEVGPKAHSDNLAKKLALLDNENTDIQDVLSEKTIDRLYLAEDFKDDKFNRQFTASSMLIYYDIIASSDNVKVEPVIQVYEEIVYLDARFMTAHIPLDLFIGSGTGVSFEMQYVDGEWKLNPYTSMMSLNLMSIINNTEK